MQRTMTMLFVAGLWVTAAASANAQQQTQPATQPAYGTGAAAPHAPSVEPVAPPAAAQPQQPPQQMGAPQGAAGSQAMLITSDSLIGAQVRDAEGKEMGTVKQLMVEPSEGKVQFAVIAVGGVLGMGEKQVAVPWDSLKLGRDENEVIVTAERQLIEQAPTDAAASAETEREEAEEAAEEAAEEREMNP